MKCHNSLARHSRLLGLVYVLLGRAEACSNTCLHLDGGTTETQARATELLYSMRAAPAPTPSVEPSPPTEMSTGGRIWEQVARACKAYMCSHCVGRVHVRTFMSQILTKCDLLHYNRQSVLQLTCHGSVKAKGTLCTLTDTCSLKLEIMGYEMCAGNTVAHAVMLISDLDTASQLN